ncbi:MAG: trypsin-like peptidase domain-containing protein [Thermogutta sp.]
MSPKAIAAVAGAASRCGIAAGWPWSLTAPPEPPHPAVARIIALDLKGASLGTGTLVAVSDTHGLVITNWHVVRDARGNTILVLFPDGFASPATVLKTDRDWDLAALAIWRPRANPVAIAREAPRPGEWLAIAGYGQGAYRTVKGICTQYLAPTLRLPQELVELRATARQGDSGGPIFNSRGELAGVLFGSGGSETMGSYCGRVREFLAPLKETFYRLPVPEGMAPQLLAAGPPPLDSESTAGLAAAAPNSAVGGTPPLETLQISSTRSQGPATSSSPSGAIPLTAVAASSLPGSSVQSYGSSGTSVSGRSTTPDFASAGRLGSGGAGLANNIAAETGSGLASAGRSLAVSSGGNGNTDWRPGAENGYSGAASYGDGQSWSRYGLSAESARSSGQGTQNGTGPTGDAFGQTSSLAYDQPPSSRGGTPYSKYPNGGDREKTEGYSESPRGTYGNWGGKATSGDSQSTAAYASAPYDAGRYAGESSSSGVYRGYATGENLDSSRDGYAAASSGDRANDGGLGNSGRGGYEFGTNPDSRGFQDQRTLSDRPSGGTLAGGGRGEVGRYSSSYPASGSYAGSGGGYGSPQRKEEYKTGEKSYSGDLADRTWDYERAGNDRPGNESRHSSSSGIVASISGNGSRGGTSGDRSPGFSARIPDVDSGASSDGRPIPGGDSNRYPSGSSGTPAEQSGYGSSGYRGTEYGYGSDGGAYDGDGTRNSGASGYGSGSARSSSYPSTGSPGVSSLGHTEGTAGYGSSAARDSYSSASHSTSTRQNGYDSFYDPKNGSSSYGQTETGRAGSEPRGAASGYGQSSYGTSSYGTSSHGTGSYGKSGQTDDGRDSGRKNRSQNSSSSNYDHRSPDTRASRGWDDPAAENGSSSSHDEYSQSSYPSSGSTGSNNGASVSGHDASSGSTGLSGKKGEEHRSGYPGFVSQEPSGAGPSASNPTAIPPTETSGFDNSARSPYQSESPAGTEVSGTNQPPSSSPPSASPGIGMETLLGLVGLLILFVQSMRWLSGFYDRAYRRRRSWRTTRRRPYYDRDVRPAYRPYW